MQKKGEKLATAKKKDGLGRGKGGAALLSPPLGSLLPSRFTPFFASPSTTEPWQAVISMQHLPFVYFSCFLERQSYQPTFAGT